MGQVYSTYCCNENHKDPKNSEIQISPRAQKTQSKKYQNKQNFIKIKINLDQSLEKDGDIISLFSRFNSQYSLKDKDQIHLNPNESVISIIKHSYLKNKNEVSDEQNSFDVSEKVLTSEQITQCLKNQLNAQKTENLLDDTNLLIFLDQKDKNNQERNSMNLKNKNFFENVFINCNFSEQTQQSMQKYTNTELENILLNRDQSTNSKGDGELKFQFGHKKNIFSQNSIFNDITRLSGIQQPTPAKDRNQNIQQSDFFSEENQSISKLQKNDNNISQNNQRYGSTQKQQSQNKKQKNSSRSSVIYDFKKQDILRNVELPDSLIKMKTMNGNMMEKIIQQSDKSQKSSIIDVKVIGADQQTIKQQSSILLSSKESENHLKVVKYLSSYESEQFLMQNSDQNLDKLNSFQRASSRVQVGNEIIKESQSEMSEDQIPNLLNRKQKDQRNLQKN